MQMYGNFEDFPYSSALFGLVSLIITTDHAFLDFFGVPNFEHS